MEGQSQKIVPVVQRLLKNEGTKALYIGSTPVLMRAFIGNAVSLTSLNQEKCHIENAKSQTFEIIYNIYLKVGNLVGVQLLSS